MYTIQVIIMKLKSTSAKRTLSLVVLACLMFTWFPASALADNDALTILPGSLVTENLDDDLMADVTLSLPSENSLDLVLVLDASTSTYESELTGQAAALLDELAGTDSLNVKAAVVVFGGSDPLLYSTQLLSLEDAGNITTLKAGLTDTGYQSMSGRTGSNLQAGIDAASSLLSADTSVEEANKHIVVLSDGAARTWSEGGVAYSQTFTFGESVLWNSIEDFVARYSESNPPRDFSEVWTAGQSGTDIGAYAMTESEKNAANPNSHGVASSTVVISDPDYHTTFEAATYYAATSIAQASVSSNITFVTYSYYSETLYGDYTESFKSWLGDSGYVSRYDADSKSPSEIFSAIRDRLVLLLGPDSTVISEMEQTVDYNFDFINDIESMTLTVDGSALDKTVVNAANPTYGFGRVGGEYLYLLTYYPDGYDSYGECFVLDINSPVDVGEDVQLSYKVKLMNPKTGPGSYGQYDRDGSNGYSGLHITKSTVLYPVDSDGEPCSSYEYGRPTVSYTVERVSASLSPATASFDRNTAAAAYQDITVTLNTGSYLLSAVQYGDTLLTSGSQYTAAGNRYTLKKEYLATLGTGVQQFTFAMSGGASPILSIDITDSAGGKGLMDRYPRRDLRTV
ncbi:MAG: X2-like carbohydrate binding domain-containing protein [Bacillota bacterium]|jgi:hypothetical protein